jgi:hypothetical protein
MEIKSATRPVKPRSDGIGRAAIRAAGAAVLCGILSLSLAARASANAFIYTYQGKDLTSFDPDHNYVCSPGPCFIEGSFKLSAELFADLNNASAAPETFEFDDHNGFGLIPCSPEPCGGATITVTGISTNASGDITAWDVTITGFTAHSYIETESTGPTGTTMDASVPIDVMPDSVFTEAYNTDMPGTWTCQEATSSGGLIPCPAASPVPTPEPSVLYLLVGGLFGLALRRKWS